MVQTIHRLPEDTLRYLGALHNVVPFSLRADVIDRDPQLPPIPKDLIVYYIDPELLIIAGVYRFLANQDPIRTVLKEYR